MPRTSLLFLALTLAIVGCDSSSTKAKKSRTTPGKDFSQAETVRITSPANGDVVDPRVAVQIEAGSHVDSFVLTANGGEMATTVIGDDGVAETFITLGPDEWELEVQGFDTDGSPLTSHSVAIRVEAAEPEQWVMVTSPRDGATVSNPVAFAVQASTQVDTVEIFADDWSLGTIDPTDILTYEFTGTGFDRYIDAVGYDDGVEIARTSLVINILDGSAPDESEVNARIMRILGGYPTDGSYDYWWPDDSNGWGGNPNDIYYDGALFAEGDPQQRSYCVGITFEVFMRAFEELDEDYGLDGDLNGVSFDELYDLRTDWYVRDLYGTGIVEAMDNYGIGHRVSSWDDVRSGDIIQFWRHSGSGHNAIFIDWETDGGGDIVGFTYWSTQGSTDGIGYNDEYFGSSGSRVDPAYFFAGRVASPEDWTPWW